MTKKLIASFTLLAFALATNAATSALSGERVALYVKDNSNPGQLRFLGAGLTSNSDINQLITQKQDLLEQLRPSGGGTATGGWGTGVGTATGSATGGFGGFGTGNGIVTPIYVNAGGNGGAGSGGSSSAINNAIINGSPVADLLPQIVSQAVLTRRAGGNGVATRRRRRPNGRRRNNGNRPQIYVVRS